MGSGALEVFATPALVALAEQTCWTGIQPDLEPGQGTVGTRLDLQHTAPTPLGMTVYCESTLTEIDGRSLTFSVKLWDDTGPVGEGTHQRVIIFSDRFQAKADSKRDA
jgi:predicted thioesterase